MKKITFLSIASFRNMSFVKQFFVLAIILLTAQLSHAQVAGDFRTKGGGNWTDYTKWQVYDGTTWNDATTGQYPTATNNVWLVVGNITTLTADAACNDIHIGASWGAYDAVQWATSRVALGTYTLRVSGKMACFTNATAFPGSPIGSYKLYQYPFLSTTGGKVSVVGKSRNLVNSGEWNTNLVTTTAGFFTLNIDLDAGETITLPINFKASYINVNSGTLSENAAIFLENGTAGQGDFTIASGATFSSNNTAGTPILMRTWNATASLCTPAGTFTNNGTLLLGGAAPQITMTTVTNNGTIEYNKAGTQTLLVGIGTGATTAVGTYNNLKLSGTSAKTLSMATTVNGSLTLAGTATLSLNSLGLTYGALSTLEYAGTSAQTMSTAGASEWSVTPINLLVNNSNGVTMADVKNISGALNLTSGVLSIGDNNLTTGSISGGSASSYVATNGTGTLTAPTTSGVATLFPIGASATTSYDPVIINPTTGTPTAVKVSGTLSGTANAGVNYNLREWTVTPTTPSATTLAFTPSVVDATVANMIANSVFYAVIGESTGNNTYNNSSINYSGGTYSALFNTFGSFVTGTNSIATKVENVNNNLLVYSANKSLIVRNAIVGDVVNVYVVNGAKVASSVVKGNNTILPLTQGLYVVKTGSTVLKISVQ